MITVHQAKSRLACLTSGTGVLVAGALVGIASFIHYFRLGLTVAHYDAKAHLLVARRIADSLEPGYAQMGANWLPLVHLAYLPFTYFDLQYRSGFMPSLISVCAFILSGWLVRRIALRATGSRTAGIFAAVLLLSNANLRYLQSCPMTEPVYMALMLLAVDSLQRWRETDRNLLPWGAASWAALGALCRYEGWYFVGGMLLLLAYDVRRRDISRSAAVRAAALCGGLFVLAVGAHFLYIYARLGDNFIRRVVVGNSAPYETYKRPFLSMLYHLSEVGQIAGVIPLLVGFSGVGYCLFHRRKSASWLTLSLLWLPSLINISALHWGLMYRVRYSVLLLPAVAIFGSCALSSVRLTRQILIFCASAAMVLPWVSWYFPHDWRHHLLAPGPGLILIPMAGAVLVMFALAWDCYSWPLLVLCVLGMQWPVLEFDHRPMIVETEEHQFIEAERQDVLNYLRAHYDGTRILIDMGRLAPLIYDSGLHIKEFVYNEGDQIHWQRALQQPGREVGWLCSEKGDEVWRLLQVDSRWGELYSLAMQTENFSIYRIQPGRRKLVLQPGQIE